MVLHNRLFRLSREKKLLMVQPTTKLMMDIIIGVCLVLLALTFVLIYLDAKDIFHLFGR